MHKQTKPKWAMDSFSLFSSSLDRRLRRTKLQLANSRLRSGPAGLLPFSPKRPCASFLCLCLLLVVCRSASSLSPLVPQIPTVLHSFLSLVILLLSLLSSSIPPSRHSFIPSRCQFHSFNCSPCCPFFPHPAWPVSHP